MSEVNTYMPDLLFVSEGRLSILEEHGVEGAPDLVIEVLSPSTARLDRGAKKKIYAATGVAELWLVDPKLKELSIFELRHGVDTPKLTVHAKDVFESSNFPGLVFSCAEIFRNPLKTRRKKTRAR